MSPIVAVTEVALPINTLAIVWVRVLTESATDTVILPTVAAKESELPTVVLNSSTVKLFTALVTENVAEPI